MHNSNLKNWIQSYSTADNAYFHCLQLFPVYKALSQDPLHSLERCHFHFRVKVKWGIRGEITCPWSLSPWQSWNSNPELEDQKTLSSVVLPVRCPTPGKQVLKKPVLHPRTGRFWRNYSVWTPGGARAQSSYPSLPVWEGVQNVSKIKLWTAGLICSRLSCICFLGYCSLVLGRKTWYFPPEWGKPQFSTPPICFSFIYT